MPDRESRTLLLVTSGASTLLYLSMLLRRLDYKVVTARSAEDALRIMEQSVPFIIITELVLPRMSGMQFLQQLKSKDALKAIPAVVLASDPEPGAQESCKRLGCAAFLKQPVEPDLLYRTLQSVSESMPRANIRLNASLKVIVGDGSLTGGVSRTEYATAISEGGLYIRTRYPQPRNALTPLRIFLPDCELLVKAIVLYSYEPGRGPDGEPGMGMKFVDLPDTDRLLIRAFIKQHLTKDIAPDDPGKAS